jgi:hypothetical protein
MLEDLLYKRLKEQYKLLENKNIEYSTDIMKDPEYGEALRKIRDSGDLKTVIKIRDFMIDKNGQMIFCPFYRDKSSSKIYLLGFGEYTDKAELRGYPSLKKSLESIKRGINSGIGDLDDYWIEMIIRYTNDKKLITERSIAIFDSLGEVL